MGLKKIAVIIGGLRYDAQTKTIQGILDTICSSQVEAYLFTCDTTWQRSANERSAFRLLRYENYDGIIFYGDTIENEELVGTLVQEIRSSGIPAVSVKDPHEGMVLAGADNDYGMRSVVAHLINVHGVKRINYISGAPDSVDSKERLAAFRAAMAEFQLPCAEDQIKVGWFRPDGGARAFREWYEKRAETPLPEAIVCASDWMAVGVLEEAKKVGVRVPEDLLLTGHDNTTVSAIMDPPLTSAPLPSYEIGVLAGERMKALLAKEPLPGEDRIRTEVVFRKSCGCHSAKEETEEKAKEIKKQYYYDSLHQVNYLDILRTMQQKLTNVGSWKELYRVVERHVRVFDADAFYMCVKRPHFSRSSALAEIHEDTEQELSYGGKIYPKVALVHGESCSFDGFSDEELMSDAMRSETPGGFYVILPLHYQSHKFGYCIACNSRIAYENAFYSLFIQIVTTAMENLWSKDRMQKMIAVLDDLWIYDKLTGVLNRSGFEREAGPLLSEAWRTGEKIFLLFADLDGLKAVNDTYGHDQGDAYILEAVGILRALHKKHELFMRFGGDEFIVMAKGYTAEDGVRYVAAIEELIAEKNKESGRTYPISISTGFVIEEVTDDFSLDRIIERADQKMYEVKLARKKERST